MGELSPRGAGKVAERRAGAGRRRVSSCPASTVVTPSDQESGRIAPVIKSERGEGGMATSAYLSPGPPPLSDQEEGGVMNLVNPATSQAYHREQVVGHPHTPLDHNDTLFEEEKIWTHPSLKIPH